MTRPSHQPFEASAWLVAIVESSHDAIISKDLNGVIQSWNRGAEEVFGYTAEEAIGQPVTMLMPPERVNEEPGILARIRSGEKVDHYTTVRRRKDGTLIDISLTVSPIRDENGTVIGASKIVRDITEHKRAEGALRETEIMHRLVEMQESERARIARDLHDHIGQMLTGIRLKVERVLDMLPADGAVTAEMNSIREIARKMDRDVGFLSRELRPTELDTLGLVNAVGAFVKEWSQQFEISAEFESVGAVGGDELKLSRDIETNLYRIVQEALNNVVKHAAATHVSVLMHSRRDGVTLIVEDNGRGFDVEAPLTNGSHGFGLIGMRERTELLGGTFDVESDPENGTSLLVQISIGGRESAASGVVTSGL